VPILPARQSIAELPPDSFFRLFVKLNQPAQVSHFLFQPGMLFNDARQWWGSKNMRPHPHEGIDLYLMQDMGTGVKNVLPQMLIPAMLSGQLVHFHRDFLGETLYIRHPEIRKGNVVLHTIYGHVQSGADLGCPAVINKGQIVGRISSPPDTTPVPAHLHISCAWIQEDQQVEGLRWKDMTGNTNVYFIDPLPFLMQ
jgi:hypothetical protein